MLSRLSFTALTAATDNPALAKKFANCNFLCSAIASAQKSRALVDGVRITKNSHLAEPHACQILVGLSIICSITRWFVDRFFKRPAQSDPTPQHFSINTQLLGPFRKIQCFAAVRIFPAGRSIMTLLIARGSTAICKLIVTVVVHTLKGVFRCRLGAHVGKKVLKRIQPSITYLNSAATVALIMWCIGVRASLNHREPGGVFACLMSHHRVSVFRDYLTMQASAAAVASGLQVASSCGDFLAAVAHTKPSRSTITTRGWSGNKQSFEALTSQIKTSLHSSILSLIGGDLWQMESL